MKNTSVPLMLAALTAFGLQARAGDVSGTVTLKGTPKPEAEITQIKDDANCSKLHKEPVKTRFYVVGSKGELADVFVTVKGITGQSAGEKAAPAIVDQKGCEYTPYVFGVQTKQKIVVKNSDPVLHNIHPTPTATGNKEENKAQMPQGPDLTFSFPSPEMFLRFKCDVHPWMFSYACVMDHPYFAVTDKDGKYTIKDLKDGKYTLEFYHRKAAPTTAPVTKEIEVKGGNVTADVELDAK